jgi:REP element-mobilizing transposase RayT
MVRGNGRQNVFLRDQDREAFLGFMGELKAARPFNLYAYCLMSNHLHLLIRPLVSTISTIMGILLTRYAKHFNRMLGREGHVFEERFRSYPCERDNYFRRSVRYIHLNPVRAGIVSEPADWPYSGHREYLGQGGRRLIDAGLLLSIFSDDFDSARAAYHRFVIEGMLDGAGDAELLGPVPVGSGGARSHIEPGELVEPLSERGNLESMAARCASGVGISLDSLRGATKMRAVCRARREFMRTALRAGFSMTEIALHLRLSLAAVSKALSGAQVSQGS